MTSALSKLVEKAGAYWADSRYYEDAERHTKLFWEPTSVFFQLFGKLNLANVIELACGHGRHAERIVGLVGHITLMDIHEGNLEVCKQRLADKSNITFKLVSGSDFRPIEDKTVTAIFCYDAMVHFEPEVVRSYLVDTARVLSPGGMALYHHSNYDAPGSEWSRNPHARNHMTFDLFKRYADEAGLGILASEPKVWGGVSDLDRVSLVVADT